MIVPFFSFLNAPEELREEWKSRTSSVIEKGVFIRGPEVLEFENSWSKYVGNKYSLGVSNGQDALILALRALGVVADDLVVLPAHSFIATHNAILALGAVPASVDVGIDGLIDPSQLETLSK
jgi:dTDP-4-amino-4,6-dideoxygalactose transaminase